MSLHQATVKTANNTVLTVLVVWFCSAAVLGIAGVPKEASAPIIAITVWGLTASALLACWQVPAMNAWAATVSLRALVSLHLTRFVGFYFFYLCRRGELPFEFAAWAGWGDIIVATLALLLVSVPGASQWKKGILIWNAIGLADIILVVTLALRLGLANWESMHALREFPLSLLPTFLVPLIIASHIIIFLRAILLERA